MSTLLVTGSTGFVGRHLVTRLVDEASLRCAVREPASARLPAAAVAIGIRAIDGSTDWTDAVAGVQTVIHLAARAHILEDRVADPLAAFRAVNTEGTLALARQAVAAGVRRLVFVSSIKVNGENSLNQPFSAADVPQPVDPYGISKHEAEVGLRELSRSTGLEVVIVRPPLVYGPGVRANFLRLMQIVERGVPLPLGSVTNRRSLVSVWNLVDLLRVCAFSEQAAGQTFMVSDGQDVSTATLVTLLAKAFGRRPRLLNVPEGLLRAGARLTGQMAEYTRLCGSLQVDIAATEATLGWHPPIALTAGIERTVNAYREQPTQRSKQ